MGGRGLVLGSGGEAQQEGQEGLAGEGHDGLGPSLSVGQGGPSAQAPRAPIPPASGACAPAAARPRAGRPPAPRGERERRSPATHLGIRGQRLADLPASGVPVTTMVGTSGADRIGPASDPPLVRRRVQYGGAASERGDQPGLVRRGWGSRSFGSAAPRLRPAQPAEAREGLPRATGWGTPRRPDRPGAARRPRAGSGARTGARGDVRRPSATRITGRSGATAPRSRCSRTEASSGPAGVGSRGLQPRPGRS